MNDAGPLIYGSLLILMIIVLVCTRVTIARGLELVLVWIRDLRRESASDVDGPTCPRCGYCLKSLWSLRCPECGWVGATRSANRSWMEPGDVYSVVHRQERMGSLPPLPLAELPPDSLGTAAPATAMSDVTRLPDSIPLVGDLPPEPEPTVSNGSAPTDAADSANAGASENSADARPASAGTGVAAAIASDAATPFA